MLISICVLPCALWSRAAAARAKLPATKFRRKETYMAAPNRSKTLSMRRNESVEWIAVAKISRLSNAPRHASLLAPKADWTPEWLRQLEVHLCRRQAEVAQAALVERRERPALSVVQPPLRNGGRKPSDDVRHGNAHRRRR